MCAKEPREIPKKILVDARQDQLDPRGRANANCYPFRFLLSLWIFFMSCCLKLTRGDNSDLLDIIKGSLQVRIRDFALFLHPV